METQTSKGFAEKFEQIKARFKLRNRDLSRIAGVSDTAINKIMSGATENPDVRTLITLGKELNLSADWILFNEGPMVKEDAVADGSLKKGLQLRDELIAQLQKELWGKPEGASDEPLSTYAVSFANMLDQYRTLALEQAVVPDKMKLKNVGGKVGGTLFSNVENALSVK